MDSVQIEGEEFSRRRFGEEQHREESPCPGCGVYYGDVHELGCDVEECPKCGAQLAKCGCIEAPTAG
jgi:hypothetical protein